ncbi:MAG: GNAT family N-acetyltransferase [Oscillospiraceae bacterium]
MCFTRFDEMYAIMTEAFPPIELRLEEEQRALLEHPCYRICTEIQEDALVGFLAYWELESCRYIEHLATRSALRGAGLGAALVRRILEDAPAHLVLEIDPPDDGIAGRRANFYRRLGFYLNDYEYFQPPLQKGMPLQRLYMMSYGAPLSPAEFEAIKTELYREVYRVGR